MESTRPETPWREFTRRHAQGVFRNARAPGHPQGARAPAAQAGTLLDVERNTLYYGDNLDVLRRNVRRIRAERDRLKR
jgi:hypothetical protein